jgi:hypothetical protein
MKVRASFSFVNYGQELEARPGALALDVGFKTKPGVIDHHHPDAEPECAASLVVKHPTLVLGHLGEWVKQGRVVEVVTHRLPDFDAVAAAFLALRLLETGAVDPAMTALAAYARLVDSSSLPKTVNPAATPHSILRAFFADLRGTEAEANQRRMQEGLAFMRFLHAEAAEGADITDNRPLFRAINRYEKAVARCEDDYFNYLDDLARARRLTLELPLAAGAGRGRVDGLIVSNPSSFLLKDWARRDLVNSPSGRGFGFLLTFFRNRRVIMGVDIDSGVNLKGLGGRLNELEAAKRRAEGRDERARWYDGNCPLFDFRIIDSPQDGTSLGNEEVIKAVLEFGAAAAS